MKTLTTRELMELEPPDWIIEDFIARNTNTVVYGPWGLGKSFMVLDMVLEATTGGLWQAANDRRIEEPLRTLYVVAEGVSFWPARVQAFMEHKGDIDEGNLLWIPEPVQLYDKAYAHSHEPSPAIRALEEVIADFRPDIFVVDTWVRCTGAFNMNEDSSTDTATVIRQLDRLRDKYDMANIIVHHPTKSGSSRGSGNLTASSERVIELKEVAGEKSVFTVVDEKGNHIQPFDTFGMRFEHVDLDEDPQGSAVLRYDGIAETASGPSLADKVHAWLLLQSGPMAAAEIKAAIAEVNDQNLHKTMQDPRFTRMGEKRNYRWEIA